MGRELVLAEAIREWSEAEREHRADVIEVTEVQGSFPGDAFAPAIGSEFRMTGCEPATGWRQSRTGLRYRTVSYVRQAETTSE